MRKVVARFLVSSISFYFAFTHVFSAILITMSHYIFANWIDDRLREEERGFVLTIERTE